MVQEALDVIIGVIKFEILKHCVPKNTFVN